MRRQLALVAAVLAITAAAPLTAPTLAWQSRRSVPLPAGTVFDVNTRPAISADSSVGFVAPALGDTVVAFAVATGEPLGRLAGHGTASGLSISESPEKRFLAVTSPNDPANGLPSAVTVVDATDPAELRVASTFTLADSIRLPKGARAEIFGGQRFGIVPIAEPVGALVTFDTVTGQQVGALTLDAPPDSITVCECGRVTTIAAVSEKANKVTVVVAGEYGELLPVSSFVPPGEARLSRLNNVAFDATARVAYVAALGARALYSFSTETGELIDSLATGGASARVTVYHRATHDIVAVTNVSRPGGVGIDVAADGDGDPSLGVPTTVVVRAGEDGALAEVARFSPDSGDELVPSSAPDFSADGRTLYVAAREGAIYYVDVDTGRAERAQVPGRILTVASAPLAAALAVVVGTDEGDRLDVLHGVPAAVSTIAAPAAEEPVFEPAVEPAPEAVPATPEPIAPRAAVLDRLAPASVTRGRIRDVQVTAVGAAFAAGSTAVVGNEAWPVEVADDGRRAAFALPARLFASGVAVTVSIVSPEGAVSNTADIKIVEPNAPIVTEVVPTSIPAGSREVDLRLTGENFREGSSVVLAYEDRASGAARTAQLRTYRLSPTRAVALLPSRLASRARTFELRVVDRDGVTSSDATTFSVVGPVVSTVRPARGTTFVLEGSNFRPGVRVYVQRQRAGAASTRFVRINPARARRAGSTRLVVTLSRRDLAAGPALLRIVNPVRGGGDQTLVEIPARAGASR